MWQHPQKVSVTFIEKKSLGMENGAFWHGSIEDLLDFERSGIKMGNHKVAQDATSGQALSG